MNAKTSTPMPKATSTPLLKKNGAQAAVQATQASGRGSGSSGSRSGTHENSIDYLGRPPSHELSESSDSRNATKTVSRKQKRPRKKKRKDRVTAELRKYRESTGLLIRKLPFQRYVVLLYLPNHNNHHFSSSSSYSFCFCGEISVLYEKLCRIINMKACDYNPTPCCAYRNRRKFSSHKCSRTAIDAACIVNA